MGRKNNYNEFHVTVRVRSRPEAIEMVKGMIAAGILPEQARLREADALDSERRGALKLIVDSNRDPALKDSVLFADGEVQDYRFTRDEYRALAGVE